MSTTKKKNGGTSDDECGWLRVVLLCKGKGADKDSYRPRSDESQWWGRRDALVRCVASFLFGATNSNRRNQSNKTKKELVLLFDEDLARLHMTLDGGGENDNDNNNNNNPSAFPKEQTIVQLWKRAAQNLRTTVEHGGMKCVIHVDPSLSRNPQSTPSLAGKDKDKGTKGTNTRGGIEKIDTKRAVLEFLQKNVSVEFLREHRLNSHPDVVLRKTNRNALLGVWDAWTKRSGEADATDGEKDNATDGNAGGSPDRRRLTRIYRELLRFPPGDSSRTGSSSSRASPGVIAGTLHETCEEFPCFGPRSESEATHHACFFLGAVRDMTSHEQRILEQVCGASGIPLVGVRFGTVPEFTSKILSLLAFHHANGVLDTALTRLLDAAAEAPNKQSPGRSLAKSQPLELQSTCLHVVCTVPASSGSVSIDMDRRDEIHWRLVRVIVCSLWRSKLASSKSAARHTNSLRLVFDDGIFVLLEERRFVDQLASQHRAAPSEHQILAALIREIDRQSPLQTPPVSSSSSSSSKNDPGEDRGWSRKKLAKRLVKDVVESSPIPITCAIGIESRSRLKQETNHHNTDELVSRFYHHSSDDAGADVPAPARGASDHGLLLAASIPPPSNPSSSGRPPAFGRRRPRPAGDEHHHRRCDEPPRMYRELLSALKKRRIPTLEQRLFPDHCSTFADREASSIIALQHMCYQNRAFGSTCGPPTPASTSENSGKKRKKPG